MKRKSLKQNSLFLPDEIWSHIFEKLDEADLEDISLVCKQFLSITNPLKTTLEILDYSMPILPSILRRFQHIESITVCATPPHVDLLHQISCSDLNSQGRKRLKTLSFERDCFLDGSDLIAIADLFPWLQEIVIPCPSESREFEYLQLKLLNLRKVTFLRSHSIISKPLNWSNLQEIDVEKCYRIGEGNIGFMMRHCPKLTSLSLPSCFKEAPSNTNFSIQNSITYAKNLHTLSFNLGSISKDHICSIMEAKPPLKNLQLNGYSRIEIQNLMMLLQACSSIQEFYLMNSELLSDRSIEEISHHLPKLTYIHLEDCVKLSTDSLFTLIKNCPFLQVIKLQSLSAKVEDVISSTNLHKRANILHLDLYDSKYVDDKTLKEILSLCPNLRSINVSWCAQLTEEGIQGILKTCVSLTELKIVGLRNVADIFGDNFEGGTIALKIIGLGCTEIKDMAFSKIGKICTGLECLSIYGSERVTKTAVMEVVTDCKKLKKLNLTGYDDLNLKFLDDLVAKSSIKRIIVPRYLNLSEDEKKRFRYNGCKIGGF